MAPTSAIVSPDAAGPPRGSDLPPAPSGPAAGDRSRGHRGRQLPTRPGSDPAGGEARAWIPGALLVVSFGALATWTWTRIEGYQLADCVEYMDRARAFARGEALDPSTPRSFAYSALLLPLFWIAQAFGDAGERGAVHVIRALHIVLAAGTVLLTYRWVRRAAGTGTAFVAAAALAWNPIFLRYSVSPLAANAAAFALVLGCDIAWRSPTTRRCFAAAFCWGLASSFAYQCLPVSACLIALLVASNARKARGPALAALLAAPVWALAQGLLDLLVYGTFASSLAAYAGANIAPIAASVLHLVGMEELSLRVYETFGPAPAARELLRAAGGEPQSLLPRTWYFAEMHVQAIAWPALLLAGLGFLVPRRRDVRLQALCFLACCVALGLASMKGAKSFRLLVPVLPFLAIAIGRGWSMAALLPAQLRRPAFVVTGAAVAASLVLQVGMLARANLAKHGSYWKAVDAIAADMDTQEPELVASAYPWAIFLRLPAPLQPFELPHPLHEWPRLSDAERTELTEALSQPDWLLAHSQAIQQDPALFAEGNARFVIDDVFHDAAAHEELGPVFLLRRRDAARAGTGRSFFRWERGGNVEEALERIQHPVRLSYGLEGAKAPAIELLGYDFTPASSPGDASWLTLHWLAGELPAESRDWIVVARLTDADDRAMQWNRAPALGAAPTSGWRPGWILSETQPIFFPAGAAGAAEFGGAHARGSVLPVRLWIALVEEAPVEGRPRLRPLRERAAGVWSADGLLQVGGFWAPVFPSCRVPDDGRPLSPPRPPETVSAGPPSGA